MSQLIFTGYGIDIVKKNDDYYIRYDDGTVAMFEKESKITFDEAMKAQKSENDAMRLLLLPNPEKDGGGLNFDYRNFKTLNYYSFCKHTGKLQW